MNFDIAAVQPMVVSFLLVLFRTGGLVMSAPMLGGGFASARARLMMALALTLVLAPLTPVPANTTLGIGLMLDAIGETAVGIAMGLVLQLAFEALLLAGEAISAGAGLSFAQMVDPLRGTSTAAVGTLFTALAMLAFLAQNGHLAVVKLLADSFAQVPPGASLPAVPLAQLVVAQGSHMFLGAMQVAIPGVIALLAVNLAMGVASRAAPQLNIFSVGLPVSVMAGLLVLLLGTEAFINGWLDVIAGSTGSIADFWGAPNHG